MHSEEVQRQSQPRFAAAQRHVAGAAGAEPSVCLLSLASLTAALPADPNVNDCSGHVDDSGCDATCMEGYTQDSGTEAHYTCDGDTSGKTGRWTGGSLTCTGVPCATANPLNDGSPVSHSQQCPAGGPYHREGDGDGPPVCQAKCMVGYNPNTGDNTYKCQTDGSWVGGDLQCTAKPCKGNPTQGRDSTHKGARCIISHWHSVRLN